MIDKIEVMLEPEVGFRGELETLRNVSPFDAACHTIKPSKYYKSVADLRPWGVDALLHIEQKRYGTSKVELLESGKKGWAQIEDDLSRVMLANPKDCRVGRVDLAADVPDVPLSWFRDRIWVDYKQFIRDYGKFVQDEEFSEVGRRIFQSLYFGKKPSCLRLYDKVEELTSRYEGWKRRLVRRAKKEWEDGGCVGTFLAPEVPGLYEFLSVELAEIMSSPEPEQVPLLPDALPPQQQALRFPVLTRIENQLGGRVPPLLHTVGQMRTNLLEFKPFARMRIIRGTDRPAPQLLDRKGETEDSPYRYSVPDWIMGDWLHEHWTKDGAAVVRTKLNRDRNLKFYLEKFADFLPREAEDSKGISEAELQERFRHSVERQLAA